jgi:interferon-induced transmembrane protein/zinc ribbon protein
MYCRQCGAQNEDNAWKCVQCGAELRAAPAAAATPAQPVTIPNYLWQSIVVTIFCCWPLGIPAIVYAAQVNSKVARGDIEGAQASSKNAKMWSWIAFGTGLLFGVVYLALVLLGVVSNMHLGG